MVALFPCVVCVEIGRSLLTATALGVTGRVLWTATDHVDSVRVPEVTVTVRGHAIS